jgi:hypothetical protein
MRSDAMTVYKMLGLGGSSMRGGSGRRTPGAWIGALALTFAVVALEGCSCSGPALGTAGQPSGTQGSASIGTGASSTAGQTLIDDIPPGRSIAEGGGGPLSYTFREEWRRARAEAQKWRAEAYLIGAAGDFVNDDGVPSSWTLPFIDKAAADVVLLVEIDPWGKVTQTRQVTGSGVSSFVGQYTRRIPYSIIDSDTAVGLGKAALASRYDLSKTRDPRIALNFSEVDGSGPFWTYTLFYTPTATYVFARVDALSGVVTQPN